VSDKPFAPAANRNREPILEVLRSEFADRHRVLEIGSGTGQHAVWFAHHLRHLAWQTSDLQDRLAGISAWVSSAALANLAQPVELDVMSTTDLPGNYDAVFSANTAHIMDIDAVREMFRLVGRSLPEGGKFLLYGPFNMQGRFTSESNQAFDASLRAQDPSMGIRDIEVLDRFGSEAGLARSDLYAMPANNFVAVWIRAGRSGFQGDAAADAAS